MFDLLEYVFGFQVSGYAHFPIFLLLNYLFYSHAWICWFSECLLALSYLQIGCRYNTANNNILNFHLVKLMHSSN